MLSMHSGLHINITTHNISFHVDIKSVFVQQKMYILKAHLPSCTALPEQETWANNNALNFLK